MIKQTAITLGLMMAAGTAFAGSAGADASADVAFGQSFAELDANGDGQVSWSEAEAAGISKTAFQSAETTQDGSLTMAEYEAAVSAKDGVVGEAAEMGKDTAAGAESMGDDAMDMSDDGMDATGDMSDDAMDTTGDMSDDAMDATGSTAEEVGGEVFGDTDAKPQGDIEADAEAGVE